MEEEIIKYYIGKSFVPELGRPHLVLVGQRIRKRMQCEKYIMMEGIDREFTQMGETLHSPVIENLTDELEQFMQYHGLEYSESSIHFESFIKFSEKGLDMHNPIIVDLKESSETGFLNYMARKSKDQLNWIAEKTNSTKLRKLINLYSKLNITVTRI